MKPRPGSRLRVGAAGELDTAGDGPWPGSLDVWVRCILQRLSAFTLPLASAPVAVFLRLRAAGASLPNCPKETSQPSMCSSEVGIFRGGTS